MCVNVCTIRDKIMAPGGLVWPCTRSIKRQLPSVKVNSNEHFLESYSVHRTPQLSAHIYTRPVHFGHDVAYLFSSTMDACDRKSYMFAFIPTGMNWSPYVEPEDDKKWGKSEDPLVE